MRANDIFNVLSPSVVERSNVRLREPFPPYAAASFDITAHPVPGKIPLPHGGRADDTPSPDSTIALIMRDAATGSRAAYIPCCGSISDAVLQIIDGVDVLLFDGTLYDDRELVDQGLSEKTGAMMGHVSMSGAHGSLARLREVSVRRRVFIHLNNSNPVLREDSRERQAVVEAGWDVAYDGMELTI
jgi:pyrroloquinoline quinone biosynthesis protein B